MPMLSPFAIELLLLGMPAPPLDTWIRLVALR
jgi:hypothetical protein